MAQLQMLYDDLDISANDAAPWLQVEDTVEHTYLETLNTAIILTSVWSEPFPSAGQNKTNID